MLKSNIVTIKGGKTLKRVMKNAKTIITERKNAIVEMQRNWDHIRSLNVSPKNFQKPFDVKALYKRNIQLENNIIDIKISQMCLNFGLKSVDDMPTESSLPTIFVLSQLKDRKNNLLTIKTNGSKKDVVVFTKKFISDEVAQLDREIAKCEIELEKFNTNFNIAA